MMLHNPEMRGIPTWLLCCRVGSIQHSMCHHLCHSLLSSLLPSLNSRLSLTVLLVPLLFFISEKHEFFTHPRAKSENETYTEKAMHFKKKWKSFFELTSFATFTSPAWPLVCGSYSKEESSVEKITLLISLLWILRSLTEKLKMLLFIPCSHLSMFSKTVCWHESHSWLLNE